MSIEAEIKFLINEIITRPRNLKYIVDNLDRIPREEEWQDCGITDVPDKYCATCECECGCDERATVHEEGVYMCAECASNYAYDREDGLFIGCSRTGLGETCHVCDQAIDWGPILTQGGSAPNIQYGSCKCGKNVWTDEDCGGWGHYGYSTEQGDEDEDE